MKSTHRYKPLRWHETWAVRAALAAAMVLACGHFASIFIAIRGIDAISRLAHDPEVQNALGEHLDLIKTKWRLEQRIIKNQLHDKINKIDKKTIITKSLLEQWLHEINARENVFSGDLFFELQSPQELQLDDRSVVSWLEINKLRVQHFIVRFSSAHTYSRYQRTDELRRRYLLYGVTLQDTILPNIVMNYIIVLIVSFMLLASIVVAVARKFNKKINILIEGFYNWSERGRGFRFDRNWSGEFRVITEQFNSMAHDVEKSRERSLYLEKIASWQTIAKKIAHEIKNPLTPIHMMVSNLKRRYNGHDQQFGDLLNNASSIIDEEIDRLRRMVDSFTQFASLPIPTPRETDLVKLCQRTLELQGAAFPQHKFEFCSRFSTLPAEVDEDLIRQVLINLLKNAAEASGENQTLITLELTQRGHHFEMIITDTGPGIPMEMQKQVFEAYVTTKHSGDSPGMGLGLAICRKIIIDHGGELALESRPGHTAFYVRIPIVGSRSENARKQQQPFDIAS